MKLNIDCMRDILLSMESADYQQSLDIDELHEKLKQYPPDDIDYSIIKLEEAGFIKALIREYNNGIAIISINDITYNGHQFLSDIRSDSVWDKIKAISKEIGSNSIHSLSLISSNVITTIIKSHFGLI